MPASFRPYVPNQLLLMPPSLQEWLPEGHLAYFLADTVAQLDLAAFYQRYEEGGSRNQPFEPRMMVTLLLYAYATGTFSSRRIAKKLDEDVAYRVLAAGNRPAHRTIAEFRQEQLGMLALDGTKLRANASKHKAMSYGRMREEEERLRRGLNIIDTKGFATSSSPRTSELFFAAFVGLVAARTLAWWAPAGRARLKRASIPAWALLMLAIWTLVIPIPGGSSPLVSDSTVPDEFAPLYSEHRLGLGKPLRRKRTQGALRETASYQTAQNAIVIWIRSEQKLYALDQGYGERRTAV